MNVVGRAARAFAWMTAPFLVISLVASLAQAENSEYGYVYSLLHVIEVIFIALVTAWTLLLMCNCIALVPGLIVWLHTKRDPNPDEVSRSRRAIATAFLSLSLPSALFLLVTLVLYSALAKVVANGLSVSSVYPPSPIFTDIFQVPDELHPGDLFNRMIDHSSTPTFLIFLYLLVAAVLLCVWGLFPLVWMDLHPHWGQGVSSELSGKWLNRGYTALSVAAIFVFFAAPTYFDHRDHFGMDRVVKWRLAWSITHSENLGWGWRYVVGSAIGLLAFHGRLQKLALGFRPVLNSILDIDNYLREFPRDAALEHGSAPRYASLLRYICRSRDEKDRPYDAIVIVAHSQGTVISADLLRFLKAESDPALSAMLCDEHTIQTYLLTLGCPLRQLYGWRFPHLYRWARHDFNVSASSWKPNDLSDKVQPDPAALGVEAWVNAYGSGDYVGASLWAFDDCVYRWSAPTERDDSDGEKPLLLKNVSEDKAGSRQNSAWAPQRIPNILRGSRR